LQNFRYHSLYGLVNQETIFWVYISKYLLGITWPFPSSGFSLQSSYEGFSLQSLTDDIDTQTKLLPQPSTVHPSYLFTPSVDKPQELHPVKGIGR
jgi:hypothetical protein